MSKLFIDLYYVVNSSFLKIETVNDIAYIHLIPTGTNRNWKCKYQPETKITKKLQFMFLSDAKFFAVIVNIFLGQKPS